jgi:hypothetical protein
LKAEKPIKKPWRIATNSQFVAEVLSKKICTHKPEEHARCEGSETEKSGFYPAKMARVILRALEKESAGMDANSIFAGGSEDISEHWSPQCDRASQATP